MSSWAPQASLVTLPPELMDFIIPSPAKLHGVHVFELFVERQEWFALRYDWREVAYRHDLGYYRTVGPHDTMQTLRALSATCKLLRAYALPLLWAVVHVERVSELGRLRDALRDAPYIAPLIRGFAFLWEMDGDSGCLGLDEYPEEHGSLLDMAFLDRGALWARAWDCHGRPPLRFDPPDAARPDVFFMAHQVVYAQPGYPSQHPDLIIDEHEYKLIGHGNGLSDDDEERLQFAEQERRSEEGAAYQSHWKTTSASGPDGNGPDRRIKNANDFNSALSEIAGQLTSLETFDWQCSVSPMPVQVLQSLKSSMKLKALHLSIEVYRNTVITVPIWELASKVTDLSLAAFSFAEIIPTSLSTADEGTEEALTAFELPTTPFDGDLNEALALHYRIACRTIVAAARGGQLRSLQLPSTQTIQHPFAIRTLLPCWVSVHRWAEDAHARMPIKRWYEAAATLRRALAHASLWLHEDIPGASDDRSLTSNDVQSLCNYFSSMDELPTFVDRELWNEGPSPLVELYLPWLEEDAELAHLVADAWNAVVERGEIWKAICNCQRCDKEEE